MYTMQAATRTDAVFFLEYVTDCMYEWTKDNLFGLGSRFKRKRHLPTLAHRLVPACYPHSILSHLGTQGVDRDDRSDVRNSA